MKLSHLKNAINDAISIYGRDADVEICLRGDEFAPPDDDRILDIAGVEHDEADGSTFLILILNE